MVRDSQNSHYYTLNNPNGSPFSNIDSLLEGCSDFTCHTTDIPFLFDSFDAFKMDVTEQEIELGKQLRNDFATFMKDKGQPWEVTATSGKLMAYDKNGSTLKSMDEENSECQFWDDLDAYLKY